jgi:hypothetical protein
MLTFTFNRFPLFYLDANDGAGSGGTPDSTKDDGANKDANQGGDTGNTSTKQDGKTFTQAELDDIIGKRLERERKAWETKNEEDKKKAAMDEATRLKAEKDEADGRATEATKRADAVTVKADVKVQLLAAGVKPERLNAALKLIETDGVTVTDGEADAKAVKALVDGFAKDYPELIGSTVPASSGDPNFKGNPPGTATEAQVREWLTDPKQREAHWAEIHAFYQAKQKK